MATTTRTISEITDELRAHPEVRGVIVWQDDDCHETGVDPEKVNWEAVEDMGIQRGWDVVYEAGDQT